MKTLLRFFFGGIAILFILVLMLVGAFDTPGARAASNGINAIGSLILAVCVIGAIGVVVQSLFQKAAFAQKDAQIARQNAFEYWLYDRANTTLIPANGPETRRSWFCIDWNRWLSQDECNARVYLGQDLNIRLHLSQDNPKNAVWRDECEVWAYYPNRPKDERWMRTQYQNSDIGFLQL